MLAASAAGDSGGYHAMVYRRAAILVTLCIVLATVASSSAFHGALTDILTATQTIIERHAVLGVATFIVIAAVSAMLAFVSIAIAVPAAVYAWGAPASIGLLWLGWILGGIASYVIGRFFGRSVVSWLTADEALRRLEKHLAGDTPVWLVTLLQLALPSEIPGYVLGLVRYPFARYAIALGLAELPYTVATVYLGSGFVEGRGGLVFGIGALLALCSVIAFYTLQRFFVEAR